MWVSSAPPGFMGSLAPAPTLFCSAILSYWSAYWSTFWKKMGFRVLGEPNFEGRRKILPASLPNHKIQDGEEVYVCAWVYCLYVCFRTCACVCVCVHPAQGAECCDSDHPIISFYRGWTVLSLDDPTYVHVNPFADVILFKMAVSSPVLSPLHHSAIHF